MEEHRNQLKLLLCAVMTLKVLWSQPQLARTCSSGVCCAVLLGGVCGKKGVCRPERLLATAICLLSGIVFNNSKSRRRRKDHKVEQSIERWKKRGYKLVGWDG